MKNKYIDDKKKELVEKITNIGSGLILDIDNINSNDNVEIVLNKNKYKILTPDEGYVEFEAIKKTKTNEVIKIVFSNKLELKCSKYHKIKRDDEFVYCFDLKLNDSVSYKDGIAKVISIEFLQGDFEVYDILGVGKKSEYFTNDIVSHNCAFIDRKSPERMNEIWAAVGPALSTTGGKAIMISTPFGTQGWYYDTYVNADSMNFNIINAHWTMHPEFNKGTYKWVKDEKKKGGGYIKFLNKTWPDEMDDPKTKKRIFIPKNKYEFICDGKVRSPWYDAMSRRLGPAKTARELDCTFVGTGGEVLPQDLIRDIDTYSRAIEYRKVYKKGFLAKYKEFERPKENSNYYISCDVMTGDGSDYCSILILEVTNSSIKIVGTLKTQVHPKYFADIIKVLGARFFNPLIIVENQGGGSTTLQELKEKNVPNIYYSTLRKKDESTGGQKRKIGFWQDDNTRTKGGDALEIMLIERELEIPCVNISNEFYTWIWDRDGKRRHAPGKHDDMIMALQNAVYVWKYVYKKNTKRRESFERITLEMNKSEDYEISSMTDPLYEDKKIKQELQLLQKKQDKNNNITEGVKKYVPKIFF